MRFSASEPGLVLSSLAHAGLVVVAVIGFASVQSFEDHPESIPVEVVSASDMPQVTPGEREAKEVKPEPKTRAVRLAAVPEVKPDLPIAPREVEAAVMPPPRPAEEKPQEVKPAAAPPTPAPPIPTPPPRPAPPVEAAAKPEPPAPPKVEEPPKIEPADAEVIRPEPPPRPPETKPEPPKPVEKPKVAAKPVPKPVEVKAEDEPDKKPVKKPEPKKPDQIAKLIENAPPAQKPAPPPAPESRFDPGAIAKLLKGQEKPATVGSAGPTLNRQAALGLPNATAAKMSPFDRESLSQIIKEHFKPCWSPPPGIGADTIPVVAISLTREGLISGRPRVVNARGDAKFQAAAGSALRAIQSCPQLRIPARFQPFYADWQNLSIRFDPETMF